MNALTINSILIPFWDSINARALEHESTMVDAYTTMKPDSFKSQLQAVLTTFYEDIKGVQSASGCSKTALAAGASGGEEAPAPAPSPPGKGSRAARKKGRASQT